MSHNRKKDECTECEVECQNEFKDEYANCPCQANCLSGCPCPNYQCGNSTTTTTISTTTSTTTTTAPLVEKDVLVLSTASGQKTPMIISFTGEHDFTEKQLSINYSGDYREASFQYGSSTEVYYSCSVEYKNEFYVFGGENIKNQVNK